MPHPGGCTTTFEALSVGTPVVTWPGEALRGRFTLALLQGAGLHDCVVESAAALVTRSVQVQWHVARQAVRDRTNVFVLVWLCQVGNATAHASPVLRKQQRRAVAEAALLLLEDTTAVHEWSRFLIRAVALAER